MKLFLLNKKKAFKANFERKQKFIRPTGINLKSERKILILFFYGGILNLFLRFMSLTKKKKLIYFQNESNCAINVLVWQIYKHDGLV